MSQETITIRSNECSNCRVFVPILAQAGENPNGVGRCRRFPRQRSIQFNIGNGEFINPENSDYPMQLPADWCGEFIMADESAAVSQ